MAVKPVVHSEVGD